jgi:hypothetical protein
VTGRHLHDDRRELNPSQYLGSHLREAIGSEVLGSPNTSARNWHYDFTCLAEGYSYK